MDFPSQYWDIKVRKTPVGQDYDALLAEHYQRTHMNLLARWAHFTNGQAILKTDLFAEAVCPSRSFLWEILRLGGNLIGIDISAEICKRVKQMAVSYALDKSPEFIPCDVRNLPFASNSFELIISDSTLDHFKNKDDVVISLKELVRTLKPGGTLIITLDNGSNFTEPLFRLWIRLGLAPFFIGQTYSIRELKQALVKIGMQIVDETAIIHNPRFFTKMIVAMLRRTFPRQCKRWTETLLNYFDSLENKRTKYLTALFIAVKATKPFEH